MGIPYWSIPSRQILFSAVLRFLSAVGIPRWRPGSYWNLVCGCVNWGAVSMRLPRPMDEPVAHSENSKSSLRSGLSICAMTGCECLSCMICAISLMNASGSSTSAWASASGLSSTVAMSISPPSFLIRAVRPSCILFRIATALFSQMHLSPLRSPFVPVIQFAVAQYGPQGYLVWGRQVSNR